MQSPADNLTEFSEGLLKKHFQPTALILRFREKKKSLGRGVDRISADVFEKKLSIEVSLISKKGISGEYKFSPYLEMLVTKGRGRAPRQIAKPTVRDKLALGALKDVLHEALPGDVPRELPNQVIRKLLVVLNAHPGAIVIKADIRSFYDKIPRDALCAKLADRLGGENRVVGFVRSAISGSIVPFGHKRAEVSRHTITEGVPQGLPISNFLANLYLSDFDADLALRCLGYTRYVDDIAMVVDSGDDADAKIGAVRSELLARGLEVSEEKTRPYRYDEPFEYLGYEIRKGKARPRKSSVEKFLRSVASLFAALRYKRFHGRVSMESWSDEEFAWLFIHEINEKITGAISGHRQYGWVFYFNESTDLTGFAEVDAIIKKMAWKTDLLTNTMRRSIKSTLTAYHKSKGSKTSGYIWNYEDAENVADKRKFIMKLGYASEDQLTGRSDQYIEEIYRGIVDRRLRNLDRDVGLVS